MPTVQFDRPYPYADLTRILQDYAAEFPQLLRLDSMGQSYEGRELWVMHITNWATGSDRDKPALWIDGNIHASELAASVACVYFIDTLVRGYGHDREITRCLDTRAFYVCPRLGPDGAEWALAPVPRIVRSSTRPYPNQVPPDRNWIPADLDGDGRILMMRVPDPNGNWQVCPEDPRRLVPRDPVETGGTYYRLLQEGYIAVGEHSTEMAAAADCADGIIPRSTPPTGLDLNRNFPARWRPEAEQLGAGDYPGSEPEVQAQMRFIANHPNLTGAIAFHTYGRMLLRPSSYLPDAELLWRDRDRFETIGRRGEELTGYHAVSVYEGFSYDPQEVVTGAFDDWAYEQQGLFSWTVELWSLIKAAGLQVEQPIQWAQRHPPEDDRHLLAWVDQHFPGTAYVNWYAYDHPQLGAVELGGWDYLFVWRNPPAALMAAEVAPFPAWLVWHALISPQLQFHRAIAHPLGSGLYRIEVTLENTGWLPTYVTEQAQKHKLAQGCTCTLELPPDATRISGPETAQLGHLAGRSRFPSAPGPVQHDATAERASATWVIAAPSGGTVTVVARGDRAGTGRTVLTLTAV
jgi:hypothetical protein